MQTEIVNFLAVEKVSFNYSENNPVLKDISFTLKEGESLGVVGPNGGGKSTLLRLLASLLRPDTGSIQYFGKKKFPYHLISHVPQFTKVNDVMPLSVKEVIEQGIIGPHEKSFAFSELLELVGLENKGHRILSTLSGGERQRALIARALMKRPKVLLLDEPNAGLDGLGQDQILNLLMEIKRTEKTAMVIVDHNINQIMKIADKVLCLNKGLHWHDKKDLLTKDILFNIYHCEFEHLLIHQHDHGEHHAHHSHEPREDE